MRKFEKVATAALTFVFIFMIPTYIAIIEELYDESATIRERKNCTRKESYSILENLIKEKIKRREKLKKKRIGTKINLWYMKQKLKILSDLLIGELYSLEPARILAGFY